jgi:hypothetical protein
LRHKLQQSKTKPKLPAKVLLALMVLLKLLLMLLQLDEIQVVASIKGKLIVVRVGVLISFLSLTLISKCLSVELSFDKI